MNRDTYNGGAMVRAIIDAIHTAESPEECDNVTFFEALDAIKATASYNNPSLRRAIHDTVAILERVRLSL